MWNLPETFSLRNSFWLWWIIPHSTPSSFFQFFFSNVCFASCSPCCLDRNHVYFFCAFTASSQLVGEQSNPSQSGGGVGYAGICHNQRQNQKAHCAADQDSGWLVGVYVQISLPCLQYGFKMNNITIFTDGLLTFFLMSLNNVQSKLTEHNWCICSLCVKWRHFSPEEMEKCLLCV